MESLDRIAWYNAVNAAWSANIEWLDSTYDFLASLKCRGTKDTMEKCQRIRVDELAKVRENEARRQALIDSVQALDDPYKTFLNLRYVEGLKMEDIADRMGYCQRYIYRIQKKAEALYGSYRPTHSKSPGKG